MPGLRAVTVSPFRESSRGTVPKDGLRALGAAGEQLRHVRSGQEGLANVAWASAGSEPRDLPVRITGQRAVNSLFLC